MVFRSYARAIEGLESGRENFPCGRAPPLDFYLKLNAITYTFELAHYKDEILANAT